jgi:hypothetical protein
MTVMAGINAGLLGSLDDSAHDGSILTGAGTRGGLHGATADATRAFLANLET